MVGGGSGCVQSEPLLRGVSARSRAPRGQAARRSQAVRCARPSPYAKKKITPPRCVAPVQHLVLVVRFAARRRRFANPRVRCSSMPRGLVVLPICRMSLVFHFRLQSRDLSDPCVLGQIRKTAFQTRPHPDKHVRFSQSTNTGYYFLSVSQDCTRVTAAPALTGVQSWSSSELRATSRMQRCASRLVPAARQ